MPNLPKKSRKYLSGVQIDPDKLRYFRVLRGLSRANLSARTGIHLRAIGLYEEGARRPREKNFRKLYTALGCGPEDLLAKGFGKAHLKDHTRGEL
jgi:transcriptional regulator with XRE-family HTH domain